MKKILRSVINVNGTVSKDNLLDNFYTLADSRLKPLAEEDEAVWEWIKDYVRTYTEPPTINSVRDYFQNENRLEVLDRLDEIESISTTYTHSDFENLVRRALKEQNERHTNQLLRDAGHILTGELQENGRTYKGHKDAIRYVMESADDILMADSGQLYRSDITGDAPEVREEFETTLENAHNSLGCATGLEEIDYTCRGIKPGELWLHAGYTGHLKTTFALTWAYKSAIIWNNNVYYYSLEMPVEQIRRILYVMHSNHPKFRRQGHEPLRYPEIRDGITSEGKRISQEKADFFRKVVDDMEQGFGEEYGHIFVECPDEPETTVAQAQSRIELVHQNHPIDLVFLDYLSLMSSPRNRSTQREELNEMFRQAKQMCLTFNNGERIPVVALHQINRTGKKEADRNNGEYKLQALADSSAAERTADVITYTYLDDEMKKAGPERGSGQTKIGCLKNRDNPQFDPFMAEVHFPSRFISNLKKNTGTVGLDDEDFIHE